MKFLTILLCSVKKSVWVRKTRIISTKLNYYKKNVAVIISVTFTFRIHRIYFCIFKLKPSREKKQKYLTICSVTLKSLSGNFQENIFSISVCGLFLNFWKSCIVLSHKTKGDFAVFAHLKIKTWTNLTYFF